MRIPFLGYIAAAGAALLLSAPAYTQDIKQPMLGKQGAKAYCATGLTDLSGKPFRAMIEAEQITDDIVVFRIRNRFDGAYKFPNIQEEFPYVGSERYIIGLSGPVFGDDPTDYAMEGKSAPAFGSSDPKQSKLTDQHKRLANNAVTCIQSRKND